MKKLLLLFVSLTLSLTVWCQDGTNNTTIDERCIIFNGTGHEHRLVDEMPTGVFNFNTRMLPLSSLPRGLCPTPCRFSRTMSHSTTR